MKKLAYLVLVILIVNASVACARTRFEPVKGVIRPGDKIDGITVEQSTEIPYQQIWQFCEFMPNELEPISYTTECEVPSVSYLDIELGWLAKESKIASNWDAMTWELYVDGNKIDLESFDWFEYEYIAKGENNVSRNWIITLKNLSPGKHNLHHSWTSGVAVDDGFNIYQPGIYEQTVNFTILEKTVYPGFSSDVKIGQHLYTSEKAMLDFLLYLPGDYGKEPQQRWPLIVYLHGAPLRGSTLELLIDQEPFPKKLEKENDFPFIAVSPLGDGEFEFWAKDEMINSLFTLLEEIQAAYSVDEKRVYLTGNDMGGNGVWAIGLRYPEYFAALAPVAGYFGWPPKVPENICDLKDVPVWAFHGGRDDIIPVEAEQGLVDALNACGGNAKFSVSQDMKMDVLYKVYADPELYEWLLSQKKAQPLTITSTEPSIPMPTQTFTLATSIDEILGTWVKSKVFYIRFDSDGTFRQAHASDQLESQPYATSTFQFEGTEFTMKEISVSGVPSCGEKIGRYEIQLLENGSIQIVEIKDECPPRAGDTVGIYDPVR